MKVRQFTINPDDVKAGRQEGSPVIQLNSEPDNCWILISDGEVGLTAYLTDAEFIELMTGKWELKGVAV